MTPPEPIEIGTPLFIRYNTPNESTMVQLSGTLVGRVMNIAGCAGVEFYDFEAHFAGDLSAASFSARYKRNTQAQEEDLFSGTIRPRYNEETDETVLGSRVSQYPIEEGGYIKITTDYSESIELNILP